MNAGEPLPPKALFNRCDPEDFDFETTETLEDLVRMVGQDRAVEAVRFGAAMPVDGYNLFVLGPPGTGRHRFVQDFLTRLAAERSPAPDWCYVNNFAEPQKPRALELPAGRGVRLRDDVEALIAEVAAVSNRASSGGAGHTRQLLEEFARSAWFEHNVAPDLPAIGAWRPRRLFTVAGRVRLCQLQASMGVLGHGFLPGVCRA